jgi:serine/threonine-protein kinase RsbW
MLTSEPIDRDLPPVGHAEHVELRVPARSQYLRLARLTVAGFASDLGFDIETLEDLRVAVDELCAVCISDAGPGAILTLSYSVDAGSVHVDGRIDIPSASAPDLHPVARDLLGMMADDYGISTNEAGRTFWLTKGPRSA